MEHEVTLRTACAAAGVTDAEIRDVRRGDRARDLHGIVLPGGESTTIAKLLASSGLHDALVRRIGEGAAVLGTCAGAILLAREGDDQVARTRTRLLGCMDIAVHRNAFGRQRESFQRDVRLEGEERPFPGVFIRAPSIVKTWGEARPIAWLEDEVVGAQAGRRIALAFHPELGGDTRLHERFVREAARFASQT